MPNHFFLRLSHTSINTVKDFPFLFKSNENGELTTSFCADVAIDWIFLSLFFIVGIFLLLSMTDATQILSFIVKQPAEMKKINFRLCFDSKI